MRLSAWWMLGVVLLIASCSGESSVSKDEDPALGMIQILDDFSGDPDYGVVPQIVLKEFDLRMVESVDLTRDAMIGDVLLDDVSEMSDGSVSTDLALIKDVSVVDSAIDSSAPIQVPDTVITFVTMEYPAVVLEVETYSSWQEIDQWQAQTVMIGGDVTVIVLDSEVYVPSTFCGLRLNGSIYQDASDIDLHDQIMGDPDSFLCQTRQSAEGTFTYHIHSNVAVWIDVDGHAYGIDRLVPLPSSDGTTCDALLVLNSEGVCSSD